ncbi:MAG: hypothetical protein QNI95_20460 [Desulfobacterales bacterium]|nr:hypothetical protein [Desulfobacterales bacterium]
MKFKQIKADLEGNVDSCKECGRNLRDVKNIMHLDDVCTICGACYQKMAFPNLHDARMEVCD